jgi:hypothetical protein
VSHTGIFGMTESGKSHLLKNELLPAWPCVIACGVNDELSVYGQQRPGRALGKLRERMTASQLAKYPSKVLEQDLSLEVVPDKFGDPASEAVCFDLIARLLIKAGATQSVIRKHNVKLLASECGPYFKRLTPQQRERLVLLATRGVTHLGVDLIVETQRPNLVEVSVRANLDTVYYFKLPEAADLDTVREKAGKQFMERVRRLPLRHHLVWRATATTESPPQLTEPAAVSKEQVA